MSEVAATITWKDVTSYRRNEPRVPSVWEAKVGPVRIVIMTCHIYYRGKWAYRIDPLSDIKELVGVDVLDGYGAKRAAIIKAAALLTPYVAAHAALTEAAKL